MQSKDTPIDKDVYKLENMKVLLEGDTFKAVYNPTVDPIQNYLDGLPNYFIINKTTGVVEGHAMSEYMAKKSIEAAEEIYAGGEDFDTLPPEFTH